MGIEKHVAVRCLCCNAVDVDTRHARICRIDGIQVNQPQPPLHVISLTPQQHGVPNQIEGGEPFTAGRNLRIDIVVRRGDLRDAPNREYRGKSILLDVTHAETQAQLHLRGGSADHDRSAASTSEARKRQHYARQGHVPFDEWSHKVDILALESFGRFGVSGSKSIDQLAASAEGRRDGGSMAKKGVVKGRLLQIVQ